MNKEEQWEKKHMKWLIVSWIVLIACGVYCAWQGYQAYMGLDIGFKNV